MPLGSWMGTWLAGKTLQQSQCSEVRKKWIEFTRRGRSGNPKEKDQKGVSSDKQNTQEVAGGVSWDLEGFPLELNQLGCMCWHYPAIERSRDHAVIVIGGDLNYIID